MSTGILGEAYKVKPPKRRIGRARRIAHHTSDQLKYTKQKVEIRSVVADVGFATKMYHWQYAIVLPSKLF